MSLFMADFLGFIALLPLLSSAFRRCYWRCVVVVGGCVPCLGCFRWLRRLVVKVVGVGVLLFSLFFCCQQWCPFLWLCLSDSATRRCCRRCWVSYLWRCLVVVVFVGFPLSFSSSLVLFRYRIMFYIDAYEEYNQSSSFDYVSSGGGCPLQKKSKTEEI